MGRMRNAYTVLVVKTEGERPHGRTWRKGKHNSKIGCR
jgi:hypothetical protein